MSTVSHQIPPQHFVILSSPLMERPAAFWSGPGGTLETAEQTTFTTFGPDQIYDFHPAAVEAGIPEDEIMRVLDESVKEQADV